MSSIDSAIAKCKQYAADNSHGYELGSRDYSFGTDCSGLVRMYAAYVEGVQPNNYPDMSTRSMKATMTSRGWRAFSFSGTGSLQYGDVLLTNTKGHTVIWLGNNQILGAEGDWDGRDGDSSGSEITVRSYYAYSWQWVLRWPGGESGTSSSGDLDVDGFWGSSTTLRLQEQAGTVADGIVSGQDQYWKNSVPACTSGWEWGSGSAVTGSPLMKKVQTTLRDKYGQNVGKIDGILGPKLWQALERAAGYNPDDGLDAPSNTVKWVQRQSNAGTFF